MIWYAGGALGAELRHAAWLSIAEWCEPHGEAGL